MSDIAAANAAFTAARPGESSQRQPVHTVYGGAQLFGFDTSRKIGAVASRALAAWARTPRDLAAAVGWPEQGALAAAVHERVRLKLASEPVEDFRIDFEDGYGVRTDDEEDAHARSTALEVARAMKENTLPPFIGIRVKPMNQELRARSVRTMRIFLTTLAEATAGGLPQGFVITLPKIVIVEQVAAFAAELDRAERELGLTQPIGLELMVETPQMVLGLDGRSILADCVAAGAGRVTGAHFGTYDYTALLGITASQQRMRHPACDFAKHMMQVALAGTGVFLSDGSTTVLPVPPHRGEESKLTPAQREENRAAVHRAWRMHFEDVMHSLAGGFYQGWDLHPAQLVTRYAALYAFFLDGIEAAGARLRNFVQKAAQATLVGSDFDDAATGQGLLNFFVRAINCGAISEQETLERTGLTLEEIRGRSFVRIIRERGQRASEGTEGTGG
ncbi:MAG TPA: hypothetical protein VNL98_10475 [Gemmatimonadales bacterium]|nr:hypothetical protein [Gemmatimonadales bacterium]